MQMSDSQRIPASKQKVWAALNNPDILKQCIPGCQSLEMTSPTEMTATVVFKVGPVKATFAGKVTLSDLDPPNSYRISGEGSGGIAGFAKGGATVKLSEESADVKILAYEVDAQIGGKLAQLGGRLIDSTAKKLAGEFFAAFGEVVGNAAGGGRVKRAASRCSVRDPTLNYRSRSRAFRLSADGHRRHTVARTNDRHGHRAAPVSRRQRGAVANTTSLLTFFFSDHFTRRPFGRPNSAAQTATTAAQLCHGERTDVKITGSNAQ